MTNSEKSEAAQSNSQNQNATSDTKETTIRSIETKTISQFRDVASGMKNLGNTCYMNAVLQALAHAPELCFAIESLPHHSTCPIAIRNFIEEGKKPKEVVEPTTEKEAEITPPDTSKKKSRKKKVDIMAETSILKGDFCTLCEFEKHIIRVHQYGTNNFYDKDDKSGSNSTGMNSLNSNTNGIVSANGGGGVGGAQTTVAPADFVRGFIKDVAPWFKLGVQEDSHEFLRLLIDAMQSSCQKAKINDDSKKGDKKENSEDEYPFLLFQGTIQSNVTCNACKESNITHDPFEDIGLEVIPIHTHKTNPMSSTDNIKLQLADVPIALERFTRLEFLDSNYKCEKCKASGSATKESRLARIPPILTLHLKRFRYGQQTTSLLGGNMGGLGYSGGGGYANSSSNGYGSSHNNYNSQSKNSNTSNHFKSSFGGDYLTGGFGGTSGSAKIEGHVRFDQFFDIRPFLTPELQKKHRAMFCRLFAVIVHTGKNSHSGHYISFVRNLAKNEWWRMDDARIVRVTTEEVMNSEAYMLFYRVVDHPVAARLKSRAMERVQLNQMMNEEKMRKEKLRLDSEDKAKKDEENKNNDKNWKGRQKKNSNNEQLPDKDIVSTNNKSNTKKSSSSSTTATTTTATNGAHNTSNKNNDTDHPISTKHKKRPQYEDGYEWAKKRMKIPDKLDPYIHRIKDKICDGVEFKFEYFQFITDEANKGGKIGCGPSGVSADDVQHGCNFYVKLIRKVLHRIFQDSQFSLPKGDDIIDDNKAATENSTNQNSKEKEGTVQDGDVSNTDVVKKKEYSTDDVEKTSDDDIDIDFQNLIPVVEANDTLL